MTNILSIAQQYTTLTHKSGQGNDEEWCGPCPKCGGDDRFLVWPNQGEHGKFHCLRGCDLHGDAIDIVRHMEDVNYREACRRFGIALQEEERVDVWWRKNGDEWEKYPINKTYSYHDADGQLVYQVVRYTRDGNTKCFGQRQPNAAEKSGWQQGTKGCTLVPYRLPDIRTAIDNGDTIYIVEGEKAVDYLWSEGIPATTNLGGCGMGKKVYGNDAYCQHFAGATVIVVADYDKEDADDSPGAIHARMIAKRLDGIAASVDVRLPGQWPVADGQGLDDWLQQGGDIDELPCIPEQESKEKLSAIDALKRDLQKCDVNPEALRFNEVTHQIEYGDDRWNDAKRDRLRFRLRELGYGSRDAGPLKSLTAVDEGISIIAHDNAYHPVRDYLDSLQWDGRDYIAELANHFVCDNDDVYYLDGTMRTLFHALFRRWIIGAVSKIYDGTQNMVLTLCGRQGLGKSYLSQWLATSVPRQYYHEGGIMPDSRDCRLRLSTTWIWAIAELGATTRRADVEALKAFLTTSHVTERRPYGRFDETFPSLASFIGTLNDGQFLSDDTGNRRFWTCTISNINRMYSTDIRPDDIWAQAVALWRQGVSHTLCAEEEQVLNRQNRVHYQKDAGLEGYVSRFFVPSEGYMDASEIADHINKTLDRTVVTPRDISGGVLRRSLINAGYESPQRVESINGRKGRYWRIAPVDGDGRSPDDPETVMPTTIEQPSEPSGVNNTARPLQANNTTRPLQANDMAQPAQTNNTARPAQANNTAQPAQTNNTARPLQANNTARPAQANNTAQPAQSNDTARPSQAHTTPPPKQHIPPPSAQPHASPPTPCDDECYELPIGWYLIQDGTNGFWQAELEDEFLRTSVYTRKNGGIRAVLAEIQTYQNQGLEDVHPPNTTGNIDCNARLWGCGNATVFSSKIGDL